MSLSSIDKLFELNTVIKNTDYEPSEKFFQELDDELESNRIKSEKLYDSIKMTQGTFKRPYDL